MKPKEILKQVKDAVRNPYAWPGGYPVYIVMSDGQLMCADCVRKNHKLMVEATKNFSRSRWEAIGAEILYEGNDEICCNCNKKLESAYGEVGNG